MRNYAWMEYVNEYEYELEKAQRQKEKEEDRKTEEMFYLNSLAKEKANK